MKQAAMLLFTKTSVFVTGLSLLLAGIVSLVMERILVSDVSSPERMPTLPVFQYEQYVNTGTAVHNLPDDRALVLVSSGAAAVGLAAVIISLILRIRSRHLREHRLGKPGGHG